MFSFQEQHGAASGKAAVAHFEDKPVCVSDLEKAAEGGLSHCTSLSPFQEPFRKWCVLADVRVWGFFSLLIYNLSSNWGNILLAGCLEGISLSRLGTRIHLTIGKGSYDLKRKVSRKKSVLLGFQWWEICGQRRPYFVWSRNREWAAGWGSFFDSRCSLTSHLSLPLRGLWGGGQTPLWGGLWRAKGPCAFAHLRGKVHQYVVLFKYGKVINVFPFSP